MKKILLGSLFLALILVACQTDNSGSESTEQQAPTSELLDQKYMEQGEAVTSDLGPRLFMRMNNALKNQSFESAITYCNLLHYDFVDTMANNKALKVRRVSEQFRNRKDKPTDDEYLILRDFKTKQMSGETLVPFIKQIDASTVAYYEPIMVQEICLNCHGIVGEDLTEAEYAIIEDKYPNDKAIGFRVGDLRGMWSVHLAK
ncbi:MAG: DUF3365 domain-containing protein [Bacteroidota bacterium]